MKYGVAIFASDEGPGIMELARLVETAGFDSLFVPEHTHIPGSRETPAPRGGELPREYARLLDPFVALTAAAVATSWLKVGTGICLVTQRDPIVLAKEVATLDWLSSGRFLFGVGAGWNLEEMRHHGTDPQRRFALLEDRVRAMQTIWAQDEASYRGRWVRFDRIRQWPKPLQVPHPPVLVAGNGPRAEERVLAYGDEWLPVARDDLPQRLADFRKRTEASPRGRLPVTVYGAQPRNVAVYADAGADRCVFWLPPRGQDAIQRRLAELTSELGIP